jgi:hypothetical protein
VERRVAQGRWRDAPADLETDTVRAGWLALALGLGFVAVSLLVYAWSGTMRTYDPYYNHFLWQAAAFLDGRAAIDFPVVGGSGVVGNEYFNDVMTLPGGGALLPFPPLPAILLMPFVAVYGLATDDQLISMVLGALDVGLAWWVVGRLGVGQAARIATTAFFAFGTVFWYAAQLGTTWYIAHVVAVGFALVAVGLAIGADPSSVSDEDDVDDDGPVVEPLDPSPATVAERARALLGNLDARQVLVGLLFGLACTARLSVAFGAPFFVLVGSGGTWFRRGFSAAVGAAIPIGALLAYNLASSGSFIHAGYEVQYRLEANGYTQFGYHPEWSVEDPRYLPQNFAIAFLSTPVLFPDTVPRTLGGEAVCVDPAAERGLFNPDCPLALPRDIGMSLLLVSPAYFLAIPALRRWYGRSRLVSGGAIAVLLITVFNLMHFSQGWVQFGWRFSNDFVPFALPLVALGIQRFIGSGTRHRTAIVGVLVVTSIAVNLWGVVWGALLGW